MNFDPFKCIWLLFLSSSPFHALRRLLFLFLPLHPNLQAHKILRVTKNHNLLSLIELRSGEVSLIKQIKEEHCKEHKGQVMWFYCKTCDVPICRDCSVVEHQAGSHELVKLDTATAAQREEIQKLIAKCKVVKKDVDDAFQKMNRMKEDLECTLNTVNSAIDDKRDSVIKTVSMLVNKEADDLKKRVAGMITAREKSSKVHEDELQLLNLRLNTALEMGNTVTTDGSNCDIASAYKPLTTTLKQLEKAAVPRVYMGAITFAEATSPVAFTPQIGTIKENTMKVVRRKAVLWNKPWKMVKKFGGTGDGKLQNAWGVAINRDGNVAVADKGAAKVYVYDYNNGRLKLAIDTTKSLHSNPSSYKSYPWGLAVHEGNYVVTDQTYYPTVYDTNGDYMKQIQIDKHKGKYTFGIAFNSNGRALVGNSNVNHIGVYRYADDKYEFSIDTPICAHFICVSSSDDNKIIISADDSSGSMVIDSKGQRIHSLHPPSDVVSSWWPTGVCTIGEGEDEQVVISNWGSPEGVYRFSLTTGKYLGCITKDVSNPQGVAFTGDDSLVVVDTNCVKVFAPVDDN